MDAMTRKRAAAPRRMKHRPGSDPRRAALNILNTLDMGRDTLDRIMETARHGEPGSATPDRRLLNAITFGVLRWRGRLDWIIARYSSTRLDRIDPPVLNILRIAVFQFAFLDKIPVSAAVDTAVELAKSTAPPYVVRFVNGVLRNAARGYKNLELPDVASDPAAALAVTHSFPGWLIERWIGRFGIEQTAGLCRAINTIPPVTLRTNTLKTTREKLAQAVFRRAETVRNTPVAPHGLAMYGLHMPVSEMEAFRKGLFQVQDEAAQLISVLLDPRPGETVLDACAGLGGKTGHIGQIIRNRGHIVAADMAGNKLARLERDMERLGISIVETCRGDLADSGKRLPSGPFDRVLLDAPCSGLGVLRRNPDAKWRVQEHTVASCAHRQGVLLDRVSRFVRRSGILVYAVCSMEPEENDIVVKDFLKNHPDFVMDTRWPDLSFDPEGIRDSSGCLRTFPHRHGMDGFFAVRLERKK